MNDILHLIRDNSNQVEIEEWLNDTANDLSIVDDHGFSILHWACWCGRLRIVEILLNRISNIDCLTNANDTPLHHASRNGHLNIVNLLIKNKATINAPNIHGNTPLHYSCHFGYEDVTLALVKSGGFLTLVNKHNKTPLNLAKSQLRQLLEEYAHHMDINLSPVPYKNHVFKWSRTRSTESSTLSQSSIDIDEILPDSEPGHTYRGQFQGMDVVIKSIRTLKFDQKNLSTFNSECKKLRILNNTNILPVIASSLNKHLLIVTQFMEYGSLQEFLQQQNEIKHDTCINFAIHIAKGMSFLHVLDSKITLNFDLNSRHVMIADDLTAKINLSYFKFSVCNRVKVYYPAWMAPEVLKCKSEDTSACKESSDMWSFAIILWELHTKQIPFSDFIPMLMGKMIANNELRVKLPSDMSSHMSKLIKICMNEEPQKRPKFDMVIPILEKLKS